MARHYHSTAAFLVADNDYVHIVASLSRVIYVGFTGDLRLHRVRNPEPSR